MAEALLIAADKYELTRLKVNFIFFLNLDSTENAEKY
jgi:hypothetical protein